MQLNNQLKELEETLAAMNDKPVEIPTLTASDRAVGTRWVDHKPDWLPKAAYKKALRARRAQEFWSTHNRTRWNRFTAWVRGWK